MDASNTKKSWRGKPTVNLVGNNFFDGNGNFTIDENINHFMPDGSTGVARLLNAQFVSDPNRTVSIGSYSLQAGQTYTLSFYVMNIDCSGFSGNLYSPTLLRVIGSIVYPAVSFDTWTRVSTTFTVPNEGPNPVVLSPQAFRDGGNGRFKLCWLQLEEGSFATPYNPATRSSTQALIDISGNNPLTASSLTYYSNNTFSFDGATNHITATNAVSAKTILAWVKLSTTAGGDYIVYGLDANGSDNWFGIFENKVYFYGTQIADVNNFGLFGTTILNSTKYYQIGCTIDGTTAKVFLNGVQENTITQAFTIGEWNTNPTIGRRGGISQRFFPGNIDSVSVYNRALSATEITQNFEAIRGKYGI
jgi:hypothetical protein